MAGRVEQTIGFRRLFSARSTSRPDDIFDGLVAWGFDIQVVDDLSEELLTGRVEQTIGFRRLFSARSASRPDDIFDGLVVLGFDIQVVDDLSEELLTGRVEQTIGFRRLFSARSTSRPVPSPSWPATRHDIFVVCVDRCQAGLEKR